MADCRPVSTPSDYNQKLSTGMVSESADEDELAKIPYQAAVGSLLYLAQCTRPDIAFAVNDVSRFNSKYNVSHWKAVKRIMRYLKGTKDYKLKYSSNGSPQLHGSSDADWASDIDKRRSCTGYLFKMSNAAINWASKRQPTVALSSTEAEYMAMSSAVQEAVWLKQLSGELDYGGGSSIQLYCDNQSAIKLAESDGFRPRSKHIDIKYHHLRETVENGIISIKYIPTVEMAGDSLTKAVAKGKNDFFPQKMGLY
ncbi:secreted RxLR effector protein 161-like [Rhagoletis pomonella]|uniref:secreted RxLR effector protein 161-like n=1 Tax=Rhagoletis pomonella TaxID=28610 RepID=UPI0017863345|nr:secreted RxLR effector protein 161-like [Rhagoletis pomonella]